MEITNRNKISRPPEKIMIRIRLAQEELTNWVEKKAIRIGVEHKVIRYAIGWGFIIMIIRGMSRRKKVKVIFKM
jgi:hypothetical protein